MVRGGVIRHTSGISGGFRQLRNYELHDVDLLRGGRVGRSHGPLSTGLTTPARSGTRPKQSGSAHSVQGHVGMTDTQQLILGVKLKESLDAHKQTVETQIIKLSESFHAHLDEKLNSWELSDIKSHINVNFKTILDMIPGGNDMTVSNSSPSCFLFCLASC